MSAAEEFPEEDFEWDDEEVVLTAEQKAVEAKIAARLVEFEDHRDDLLAILQKACERRPRTSFKGKNAWREISIQASVYLRDEACIQQEQMRASVADRAKLLRQLGATLSEARCKLDEVRRHDVRASWFAAWWVAHDNPDSDPIIELVNDSFDKRVDSVIAGLADLETAAVCAARKERQSPGRPPGTGLLPHDFIVRLESIYRDITGKTGGAGPGPFSQFVEKFLIALGRHCAPVTVIDAIKDAKKREENHPMTSRWGRSYTGF